MSPEPHRPPPLIVLAGSTGVGKTSLAIEIARHFSGEIVNADSRSFYRGMDIGTAKPTPADLAFAPHHLIDILEPAEDMSLAHFQEIAFRAIDDVLSRGRLPLLVGGTAQYLNAVVENWKIPRVAPDNEWRRAMEQRVADHGFAPMLEELREVDAESAERCGSNPRRIIRALEVYRATGIPMSRLQGKRTPRYSPLFFELWLPREILHLRIAERVDRMFDLGLVEEIAKLIDAGVDPAIPSFSSIGYREVVPFLCGESTIEQTKSAICHASNRLIRHQQTWFRKDPDAIRIDMTQVDAQELVIQHIRHHLADRMPHEVENESYS